MTREQDGATPLASCGTFCAGSPAPADSRRQREPEPTDDWSAVLSPERRRPREWGPAVQAPVRREGSPDAREQVQRREARELAGMGTGLLGRTTLGDGELAQGRVTPVSCTRCDEHAKLLILASLR